VPLYGPLADGGKRPQMKVLVTGGAGFIGSHIVDALIEAGAEVRTVDRVHPAAHRSMPDYINGRAEFFRSDLRDEDSMTRALEGVDAVCHHAAMVGLGKSFADVTDYVDNNDSGTACLLRAMFTSGFAGRLVLGSSMAVYGEGVYRCSKHGLVRPESRTRDDLDRGHFDPRCPRCSRWLEAAPIGEEAPVQPGNVYAATKLHQEHLCFSFGREARVPVSALRYHNVYGPRMPRDTPYAGVASVFRSRLEEGAPPRVFEDGRQMRDFVHVTDVAGANVRCLLSDQAPRGSFNIASGDPHTVGEMAKTLAAAFGPRAAYPQVCGSYRVGDARHIVASPQRANRMLGWRAHIPFDVGMKEFATAPLR
jgi:dTDP-L-rhamnose 4-epimerase